MALLLVSAKGSSFPLEGLNIVVTKHKIKLKKEWKNVIVTDKKPNEIIRIIEEESYAEPKEVKDGFYSSFADFKIKGSVIDLFGFVMDYAPSSIEVLTTKDAKLSITDLQALLNDLSGRMNEMDQRLKIFSGQTILLSQQLEELKKKIEMK